MMHPGTHHGSRGHTGQLGHGGPEAREPPAALLWEVPGSKQCAAVMQCHHHGNHTCTQCHHQWCTLPPHHTCMKGPGNAHKCVMPSRCMRCTMMEQGDNSAQAPPEYQGRHWCPPTNIMSRDSSAAHKCAVPRMRQGMPRCDAHTNGHHQCHAQPIACNDHACMTTLPHRVKASMMHMCASLAMGTLAKYHGGDTVLPQWQQQVAMMQCNANTMATICQCKSAQCRDQGSPRVKPFQVTHVSNPFPTSQTQTRICFPRIMRV